MNAFDTKALKEQLGDVEQNIITITRKWDDENRPGTDEEMNEVERLEAQKIELERKIKTEEIKDRHAVKRDNGSATPYIHVKRQDIPTEREANDGLRAFFLPSKERSRYPSIIRCAEKCGIDLQSDVLTISRAQAVGTPGSTNTGGILVQDLLASNIEHKLKEWGAIRKLCNIQQTSSANPLPYFYTDNTLNTLAEHTENTADPQAISRTYSKITLNSYPVSGEVAPISYELIASVDNIVGEITSGLVETYGRKFNALCTTGSGSDTHNGIDTAVAASLYFSNDANDINWHDVFAQVLVGVDVEYNSVPSYAFMISSDVYASLLVSEDSTYRPLWATSLREGEPNMIMGKRYVVNQDLPNGTVIGGDWSKFKVREVGGVQIQVFRELYARQLATGVMVYGMSDSDLLPVGAFCKAESTESASFVTCGVYPTFGA